MLSDVQDPDCQTPVLFTTGEEAWFWTMATLLARQDGASATWQPAGPARPCEAEDVLKCLDILYQRGAIGLLHARALRYWGERQIAPSPHKPNQLRDYQLWRQVIGQLEWALRARAIVR